MFRITRTSLGLLALAASALAMGAPPSGSAGDAQPVVRFLAISSWGDPMGRFDRDKLVGGLNYDLILLIAKHAGVKAELITFSRNRATDAIEHGDVDVRCNSNPEWVSNPQAYVWSESLFEMRDLVVWRIGNAPINALDDLRGKTVTGVLGYRYPPLQQYLDSGSLTREDAPSQDQVLHMLGLGRANYAITNSISLTYYLQQNPAVIGVEPHGFVIAHSAYRCGVRHDAAPAVMRVLAAIDELSHSRELSKLLATYE